MGKGNKPQKNDKSSMKPKKVGTAVTKKPITNLFGMDAPNSDPTGSKKKSYGR